MGFRLPRFVIPYISNSDVIHRQKTIERECERECECALSERRLFIIH